jgi:hypothetical protein
LAEGEGAGTPGKEETELEAEEEAVELETGELVLLALVVEVEGRVVLAAQAGEAEELWWCLAITQRFLERFRLTVDRVETLEWALLAVLEEMEETGEWETALVEEEVPGREGMEEMEETAEAGELVAVF